ncbi:vitelline membrane outer layer protein 1-like [Podarcis muralis]
MDFTITTMLFLILFSCLAHAEDKNYNSILTVTNGGPWGTWGMIQFCPRGYAHGFSLKLECSQRLHPVLSKQRDVCAFLINIDVIFDRWGSWTQAQYCSRGNLVSFSLRVEEGRGIDDDTAANNIMFICKDGEVLKGHGLNRGHFGSLSRRCTGSICGIQTKVEDKQGLSDDTALNDVHLYCCF